MRFALLLAFITSIGVQAAFVRGITADKPKPTTEQAAQPAGSDETECKRVLTEGLWALIEGDERALSCYTLSDSQREHMQLFLRLSRASFALDRAWWGKGGTLQQYESSLDDIRKTQRADIEAAKIQIEGDKATATLESKDSDSPTGTSTVKHSLRKIDGRWLIEVGNKLDLNPNTELMMRQRLEALERVLAKVQRDELKPRGSPNTAVTMEMALLQVEAMGKNPTAKPAAAEQDLGPTKASKDDPLANGESRRIIASGRVRDIAINHDETILVSGAGFTSEPVVVWDIATGTRLRTLSTGEDAMNTLAVAISPDDSYVVAAGEEFVAGSIKGWGSPDLADDAYANAEYLEPVIWVWDLKSGKIKYTLQGHERYVCSLDISPSNQLATVSFDGEVRIWDLSTGANIKTINLRDSWPVLKAGVQYSPDGSRLLTMHDEGKEKAIVWKCADWSKERELNTARLTCRGQILADNETVLLCRAGAVSIWRPGSDKPENMLFANEAGMPRQINRVALSQDEKTLLTAEGPEAEKSRRLLGAAYYDPAPRTRMIDLDSRKAIATWKGHKNGVGDVLFLRNGIEFLTCSADSSIRFWKLPVKNR